MRKITIVLAASIFFALHGQRRYSMHLIFSGRSLFMMRIFFSFCLAAVLAACSSGNANISAGTHNLSKGDCRNIQVCEGGKCRTYHEAMTQAQCAMLGGEYTPRDYKGGWLF